MFQFTITTTDHPTRIRFVSNQPLGDDQIDFTNADDAGAFPLIQQLFYLPFVKHVRLTENWIEVERFDILEWASWIVHSPTRRCLVFLKLIQSIADTKFLMEHSTLTVSNKRIRCFR